MTTPFVHLHVHTEYSLVDSVVRIKPLLKQAAETMPAMALTDHGNMMALVKFYRAAMGNGVKPIGGVDAWIENTHAPGSLSRMVMLAQTEGGYKSLARLVSKSFQEGQRKGLPIIQSEWIEAEHQGIIALSGARNGDIGQALLAGNRDLADERLQYWRGIFQDRYYLEVQRCGRPEDERHLQEALALAVATDTPLVATNDVCMLQSSDFSAHEARVCINRGDTLDNPNREKRYSDQQYLKTPEEMAALFADIPQAIENTVEIAKRCNIKLYLGTPVLPDFPVPEGMTEGEYFRHRSREGLEKRLEYLYPDPAVREAKRPEYSERLEIELDVILQMGFPGYFLIVADFIQWSKDNGIPVGPGRGSGAGSLVAYALLITDLDPLPYDLLFERFLNPERVSMPDFDIDFCMDGRDAVIAYVARKYGKEKVSQIITYGSMAAKAVVRDCGRVLGHGYGFVDSVAKLIPFEVGMTLTKALEESPDLKQRYNDDEEVTALIDLALQLEGLARNCGKHAGGVVIAPSGLTDFCPLYCEEDGSGLVTQFDKDDAEAVGLVKFDFLGLRTLTIIDNAVKIIEQRTGEKLDIMQVPLDDKATYRLLKNANTTAVFQLESRGMKELIKRLKPDCFEDIVALVALFRPGPLGSGMVDDFINRKHGIEEIVYPHPDLEQVLKPTYGVILYQEQVMQIAQVLAGYSLGGADLLRRAMGKKKPEEMDKQRVLFTKGALERGVEEETATYIFDLMEKFAGYGFNKSHSAAYALLSYQTAWLKHHHPAAFMCAVLSADLDNTEKVVGLIEDSYEQGLKVLPPDVNESAYKFTVTDEKVIRYGLGAIKGVGEAALFGLIEEREHNGHYRTLDELCERADGSKVNKRVLEALIHSGSFDGLAGNRRSKLEYLPEAMKAATQAQRDRDAGQVDLFGAFEEEADEAPTSLMPELEEWPERERLRREKEPLGLYLTGHPIRPLLGDLERITKARIKAHCAKVPDSGGGGGEQRFRRGKDIPVKLAGLIVDFRVRTTAQGKMAIVTLDDESGRVDAVIGGDLYDASEPLLKKDEVLVVDGDLGIDDFSGGYRIRAKDVMSFASARERAASAVSVAVDSQVLNAEFSGFSQALQSTLQNYHGAIPVSLRISTENAQGNVWLEKAWRVSLDEGLLDALNALPGCGDARIEYVPDRPMARRAESAEAEF